MGAGARRAIRASSRSPHNQPYLVSSPSLRRRSRSSSSLRPEEAPSVELLPLGPFAGPFEPFNRTAYHMTSKELSPLAPSRFPSVTAGPNPRRQPVGSFGGAGEQPGQRRREPDSVEWGFFGRTALDNALRGGDQVLGPRSRRARVAASRADGELADLPNLVRG